MHWKSILLLLVYTSIVACQVPGTWYLNLNISNTNIYPTLIITQNGDTYSGIFMNGTTNNSVENIEYTPNFQSLTFSVSRKEDQLWFWGRITSGIIKGRFAISSSKPPNGTYIYHFTGWSEVEFPLQVPLAYDVTIYGNCSAKIRIDRDPNINALAGRYKLYFCNSVEGLEYDLQDVTWSSNVLAFTVVDVTSNWTLYFKGVTSGNLYSGVFVDSRNPSFSAVFSGKRADVLGYGLFPRNDRTLWQQKTRIIIEYLMMDGNPTPLGPPYVVSSKVLLNQSYDQGASRDDNPEAWAQNFTVTEYHLQWTIQDPYSATDGILFRNSHCYLVVPNDVSPNEKLPALIAVNGHRGSGWQSVFPNSSDIYWYGNAFGRRKFIVLAVDISHRNDSPLYSNYNFGDDPQHGNGPHPAIISPIFDTTDWEEDGERTWDAMRGVDFLLSLPLVDPSRVIVGGLSMGGGITSYVAALDLRIAGATAAGWSPDYDVIFHHGNHPCYLWVYANLREYLDSSDVIALIAPRPFIVETGKQDFTFSAHVPPFAGDKQVARRARAAYGNEANQFIHYLHYDVHRYHIGDINPLNKSAERWVQEPIEIAPLSLNDLTWQVDPSTTPFFYNRSSEFTLFELVGSLLV